jgi:hypothetical protein
VPYPAGGSSDIIARAISQPLSDALKQSVIVDNKAGANGNLGADIVAKSAPDGYTLLLCETRRAGDQPIRLYQASVRSLHGPARGHHAGLFATTCWWCIPRWPANGLKELVAPVKQQGPELRCDRHRQRSPPAGVALERASGATLAVRALQGRRAGRAGHRVRPDPGADETACWPRCPHVQSGKLKVLGVPSAPRMP